MYSLCILSTSPKDSTSYYKDICSSMFIAVLFIRSKIWQQTRCPSTEEWIMKMCSIFPVGYYLTVLSEIFLEMKSTKYNHPKFGNLYPGTQILYIFSFTLKLAFKLDVCMCDLLRTYTDDG